VNYSNKVFIATTDFVRIRNSNVLNCHFFCRECFGITPFSCTRCYNGFTLTGANYCEKDCDGTVAPIYYSSLTNDCEACHATCERCTSGSETSCTECHTLSPFLHPDSSCSTECKEGTYEDPPGSKICKLCHPECNTCFGGNNDQCLTCYVSRGYNLQSGGYNALAMNTCQKGCLSGSYLVKTGEVSEGKCLNCNSECLECNEGTN
jgi:proprotein convertase subtilisin/kexin type 5